MILAAIDIQSIILAGVTMVILGGAFAVVLLVASIKLKVTVDPKIEAVHEALPNIDCGACGFAGCASYAKAVVFFEKYNLKTCLCKQRSAGQAGQAEHVCDRVRSGDVAEYLTCGYTRRRFQPGGDGILRRHQRGRAGEGAGEGARIHADRKTKEPGQYQRDGSCRHGGNYGKRHVFDAVFFKGSNKLRTRLDADAENEQDKTEA